MEEGPKLGRLVLDGDRRRDAVHIAVIPVIAGCRLEPGQRVRLRAGTDDVVVEPAADGDVPAHEQGIGIVDPFLPLPVAAEQRFWLFLYPNTVTSLRHVWTHPAFRAAPPAAGGATKP